MEEKKIIENLVEELTNRSKEFDRNIGIFRHNIELAMYWKGKQSESDYIIDRIKFILENDSN